MCVRWGREGGREGGREVLTEPGSCFRCTRANEGFLETRLLKIRI